MAKKSKTVSEEEKLVNYAIQKGVGYLIKEHPLFGGFQQYIADHVNQDGIWNKFNETYSKEIEDGTSRDNAKKIAYKKIESYIASGNLLDEEGKKVILTEGLKEETGGLRKLFHNEMLGEKYLNATINTFKGLDNLMQSGDYAERHKEMADAITKLKDSGFHYAATRILREGGIIDANAEKSMLKMVYKKVDEQPKRVIGELEQKIAAFVGILLVLFNLRITGAVIGGDSVITGGIVGIFMLLFSLLLYFRPLKRTFKK